jgi:hypothetical protein
MFWSFITRMLADILTNLIVELILSTILVAARRSRGRVMSFV